MRIIDLLNKIANGEEVPKIILFDSYKYRFDKVDRVYRNIKGNSTLGTINELDLHLNDEVEILDDDDEEKESLYKPYALFELEYTDDLHEIIKKSNINFKSISEKVNEIIYYLEKQRKGE